jgi:hypothetical protein
MPIGKECVRSGFQHGPIAALRRQSSVAIDPAIREQVDLGLGDLFEIAKAPPYNYTGFTDDLHKWHVWLMPPNREKCVDPAFTLRTTSPLYPNGWDQDPTYDKDPNVGAVLLCVAGFMERSNNEPGMVIVASGANARNTARFEGEHNVLLEADPDKFKATSNNHHHPLIPRADGSQIINSDTDSRSASVRLDELFVLPEGFESYGKTRIHIILSK